MKTSTKTRSTKLGMEQLGDRIVPTVRLVNHQLQLLDDAGVVNSFTLNYDGHDILVTDRGATTHWGFADVSEVKAMFGSESGESINIEANGGKSVDIEVGTGGLNVDLCKVHRDLDYVTGSVVVHDGNSSGKFNLTLNDQANPWMDTYSLTDHSATRPLSANVTYTAARLGTLTLSSGTGKATFNVDGTSAAGTTVVNTGTGGDTVNVGLGHLGNVHALTIDGGGAATVNMNDSLTQDGGAYRLYAGRIEAQHNTAIASVTYGNTVAQVNLTATNAADTFGMMDAAPPKIGSLPLSAAVYVDARNSAGDTLYGPSNSVSNSWWVSGRDSVALTANYPLGQSRTVTFWSLENLHGGSGNDTYKFADGAGLSGSIVDTGGTDTLDYSAYRSAVNVDLFWGRGTGIGGGFFYADIENATGGSGSDRIWGNNFDNKLSGGSGGNDVLVGRLGSDTLVSGGGRCLLIGGGGADTLLGGKGEDILIAGSTTHDENSADLDGIMSVWGNDRLSNGGRRLSLGFATLTGSTVSNDGVKDTITRNGGQDWVFSEPIDVVN